MLSLLLLFFSVAARFPFPISLSVSTQFSALRGPENVPRAPFLSPSSSVQFINLSLGIWQSGTPPMLKVASLCASFSQFRGPRWTLQLGLGPWCPSHFESSDILVLTKGWLASAFMKHVLMFSTIVFLTTSRVLDLNLECFK